MVNTEYVVLDGGKPMNNKKSLNESKLIAKPTMDTLKAMISKRVLTICTRTIVT